MSNRQAPVPTPRKNKMLWSFYLVKWHQLQIVKVQLITTFAEHSEISNLLKFSCSISIKLKRKGIAQLVVHLPMVLRVWGSNLATYFLRVDVKFELELARWFVGCYLWTYLLSKYCNVCTCTCQQIPTTIYTSEWYLVIGGHSCRDTEKHLQHSST
jgi:hypothetical protein